MTTHVNDAGTWKLATPYVNDAGVWKQIVQLWVNDTGTWKLVSQSGPTFNPVPGIYSVTHISDATFSVASSENVTWTYTKSSLVVSSLANGSTGTDITFSLSTTTNPKTGTVDLTATLNGLSYTWSITLDATGTA